MSAAAPGPEVPRWSAPKTNGHTPTLVTPSAGQRVWGVGIGLERRPVRAQNLEIAAAARDDVVLCEPTVPCRWHIVGAVTTIVCGQEHFDGVRAWAHCAATGGRVDGIEVRVSIANAQGHRGGAHVPRPVAIVCLPPDTSRAADRGSEHRGAEQPPGEVTRCQREAKNPIARS